MGSTSGVGSVGPDANANSRREASGIMAVPLPASRIAQAPPPAQRRRTREWTAWRPRWKLGPAILPGGQRPSCRQVLTLPTAMEWCVGVATKVRQGGPGGRAWPLRQVYFRPGPAVKARCPALSSINRHGDAAGPRPMRDVHCADALPARPCPRKASPPRSTAREKSMASPADGVSAHGDRQAPWQRVRPYRLEKNRSARTNEISAAAAASASV